MRDKKNGFCKARYRQKYVTEQHVTDKSTLQKSTLQTEARNRQKLVTDRSTLQTEACYRTARYRQKHVTDKRNGFCKARYRQKHFTEKHVTDRSMLQTKARNRQKERLLQSTFQGNLAALCTRRSLSKAKDVPQAECVSETSCVSARKGRFCKACSRATWWLSARGAHCPRPMVCCKLNACQENTDREVCWATS